MEVKILTKEMFMLEMKFKYPFIEKEEAKERWDKVSGEFNYIFKLSSRTDSLDNYIGVRYLNHYLSI